MIRRSFFLTSLLSLCIAAPVAAIGCAAPTDSADSAGDSDEQVAESQDELTSAASQLVGSFWTHQPAKGGFARLELKANGHFTASVDPDGRIVCVTSPCLQPESGTWNASHKTGGGYRLRIRPTGEPSRWYDATKSGGASAALTLHRSGVTETLHQLGANACLDDGDCKPSEECAPRYCLMYCAFNDPFCCGPSTCKPKAPPPPSTPCGPTTCGVGKVCCNPLAGICTNPGEFCIQ